TSTIALADIIFGTKIGVIAGTSRGRNIFAKSGGPITGVGGAGVVVITKGVSGVTFLLTVLIAAIPILVIPVVTGLAILDDAVSAPITFSQGVFDLIWAGFIVAITIRGTAVWKGGG